MGFTRAYDDRVLALYLKLQITDKIKIIDLSHQYFVISIVVFDYRYCNYFNALQNFEAEANASRKAAVENYENGIKFEEKAQWQAEGQKLLFEAKRENVLLQLEAIYRERAMQLYSEVNLAFYLTF